MTQSTDISHRAPTAGEKTDPGYAKKPNQDAHGVFKISTGFAESAEADGIYVAVVADGVTNSSGGEKASELAIETIRSFLKQRAAGTLSGELLYEAIDDAIYAANRKILAVAQENPQWGNMSTTLVMAVASEGTLQLAHLGDSRAYLVRKGQIHRLTLDHNWAQEALDNNRITKEALDDNPNRNVIQRYLGNRQTIDIDRDIVIPGTYHLSVENRRFDSVIALQEDDVILLCTDGLTDKVSDQEILEIIEANIGQPPRAARRLIAQALKRKERDNITAVLLSYAETRQSIVPLQLGGWTGVALAALVVAVTLILLYGSGLMTPSAVPATSVSVVADSASVMETIVSATPTAGAAATIAPTLAATPSPTPLPLDQQALAQATTVTQEERGFALQTNDPDTPTVAPLATQTSSITLAATNTTAAEMPTSAIIAPTQKPTSPPTPTETFTPPPTLPSISTPTAIPVAEQDTTESTTNSPAAGDATIQDAKTNIDSVQMRQSIEFSWRTNYQPSPNEALEVVMWRADQAAENENTAGGVIGVKENPPTQKGDQWNLTGALPGRYTEGPHKWGVWLVEIEPYERKAYLGTAEKILTITNGSSGGGSGGGCTGIGCDE